MSDKKIKMGRISYINASPVYYGLDHGLTPSWLELVTDVPASLNRQILLKEIQISPVSAAHYAMHHDKFVLLPDLSISCHGEVLSVLCASRFPLEDLNGKTVLLSRESATGANLLKLILTKKQISPEYITQDLNSIFPPFEQADAIMVIGDKALSFPWEKHFAHVIDLGQAWFEMTKLPFVFAVWVVNTQFASSCPEQVSDIISLLHQSRTMGYESIEKIVAAGNEKLGLPLNLLHEYYRLLSCDMDDAKIQGMRLFFDSLFSQGLLPHKVSINFFDKMQ